MSILIINSPFQQAFQQSAIHEQQRFYKLLSSFLYYKMSDFARKQLEKYGWTEGKGLGKKEDGITKPIKASMKFDTQGIGHNHLDIWTSMWWCDAFNQAAKRINVINTKTGVRIKSEKPQTKLTPLSSSKHAKKNFVKAGIFEEKGEILTATANTLVPSISKSSSLTSKSNWNYERMKKPNASLKRRHIRVMEQDAIYMKKMKRSKQECIIDR